MNDPPKSIAPAKKILHGTQIVKKYIYFFFDIKYMFSIPKYMSNRKGIENIILNMIE